MKREERLELLRELIDGLREESGDITGESESPYCNPDYRESLLALASRADARATAISETLAENERLRKALELASVRLEILTGRARACHEETGRHGLLSEATAFCEEARAALAEEDDKA